MAPPYVLSFALERNFTMKVGILRSYEETHPQALPIVHKTIPHYLNQMWSIREKKKKTFDHQKRDSLSYAEHPQMVACVCMCVCMCVYACVCVCGDLCNFNQTSVHCSSIKSYSRYLEMKSRPLISYPYYNSQLYTFNPQFSILQTASQSGSYNWCPHMSLQAKWT